MRTCACHTLVCLCSDRCRLYAGALEVTYRRVMCRYECEYMRRVNRVWLKQVTYVFDHVLLSRPLTFWFITVCRNVPQIACATRELPRIPSSWSHDLVDVGLQVTYSPLNTAGYGGGEMHGQLQLEVTH